MIELTNAYLDLVGVSEQNFKRFSERVFPFKINYLINKIFILLEPHARAYQKGKQDLSQRYGLRNQDKNVITNPDGSVTIAPHYRVDFFNDLAELQKQKFTLDNVDPIRVDLNDEIYNSLSVGEGAILYPLLDSNFILPDVDEKCEDKKKG